VQLVGKAHSSPDETVRKLFLEQFTGIVQRFIPALQRTLPGIPSDEITMRFHFAVGAMAYTLAWSSRIMTTHDGSPMRLEMDTLLDRLVRFSAAGMRAPIPEYHPYGERP
jgi:hypothetical protein